MKLLSSPEFSCIIEASMIETEQMFKNKDGIIIHGQDAKFLLVQGQWIMILPPKEVNKETKEGITK